MPTASRGGDVTIGRQISDQGTHKYRGQSVTLYEAENASGLARGRPFRSLGLRDQPVQKADGSTDINLGPVAP